MFVSTRRLVSLELPRGGRQSAFWGGISCSPPEIGFEMGVEMDGEQGSMAHNFAAGKIGVKSNGGKEHYVL